MDLVDKLFMSLLEIFLFIYFQTIAIKFKKQALKKYYHMHFKNQHNDNLNSGLCHDVDKLKIMKLTFSRKPETLWKILIVRFKERFM